MDIQFEKIQLMKLLLETEDVSIIESIKQVFQKSKKDWWEELSEKQQEAIEKGFEEIDRGESYSFEEVMNILKG